MAIIYRNQGVSEMLTITMGVHLEKISKSRRDRLRGAPHRDEYCNPTCYMDTRLYRLRVTIYPNSKLGISSCGSRLVGGCPRVENFPIQHLKCSSFQVSFGMSASDTETCKVSPDQLITQPGSWTKKSTLSLGTPLC